MSEELFFLTNIHKGHQNLRPTVQTLYYRKLYMTGRALQIARRDAETQDVCIGGRKTDTGHHLTQQIWVRMNIYHHIFLVL